MNSSPNDRRVILVGDQSSLGRLADETAAASEVELVGSLQAALDIHSVDPNAEIVLDPEFVEDEGVSVLGVAEHGAVSGEHEFQKLFRAIEEAFVLCEVIRDESGKAVDYRYLMLNPAWETQTGMPVEKAIGRTARELFPGLEDWWVETADRVVRTGETIRDRHYTATIDKWLDVYVYRYSVDRFASVFVDATERAADEARVREGRTLLQSIIDNTPAAVYVKDLEGRLIVVNETLAEMLGRSREWLLGKTSYDVYSREVAEAHIANDRQVIAAGEPCEAEELMPHTDGDRIFITQKFPLKREDGTVYAVAGISTDITARKRAEEALNRNNVRLKIVSDAASLLLASDTPEDAMHQIIDRVLEYLDCQVFLNYLRFNDSTRLKLHVCAGLGAADCDRLQWLDVGTAVCGAVAETCRGAEIEDVQNSPMPDAGMIKSLGLTAYICLPLTSHRGRLMGTFSFGSRTKKSFSADDKSVVRILADSVAIALERKLSEQELDAARSEAERRAGEIESLVANIPDGLSIFDSSGSLIFMNDAGRSILQVAHEEDLSDSLWSFQGTGEDGTPMNYEQTATARALRGEVVRDIRHSVQRREKLVTVSVSASPVRDSHGSIIGATTTFRDVSERAELEKEREELLQREHNIAQVLQRALIPADISLAIDGYRLGVRYEPALREAEIGGDFYDIFDMGEGRFGILIGDVAGKGLWAAIRVAAARYTIKGYSYLNSSPGIVLSFANDALCKEGNEESGMLTAFFGVIDTRSGVLTYSSAGHEPPATIDLECRTTELQAGGIPLGVMGGFKFSENKHSVKPGEKIVMVTDGITEARAPGVRLYEKEGVVRALLTYCASSPDEIAQHILEDAKSYAGGHLQDDAAIVVVERTR